LIKQTRRRPTEHSATHSARKKWHKLTL
jgi:hypothetical protein